MLHEFVDDQEVSIGGAKHGSEAATQLFMDRSFHVRQQWGHENKLKV